MTTILALRELEIVFPESESDKEIVMNDFKAISSGRFISGCVGCVDGCLCVSKAPSAEDAGDVGTGQYACPGINVQAMCDARCLFTSVNASYLGSANDARAFCGTGVARSLNSFPTGMYIIGDNAKLAKNGPS